MLRRINTGLHLAVLALLVVAAPYNATQLLQIAVCMLACWAATFIAASPKIVRDEPHKFGLLTAVITLYFIGYLTKFGLALYLSEDFWVVPRLISSKALISELPAAYLVTTVGYVSVLTGILAIPSKKNFTREVPEFQVHFSLIVSLLCGAYVVKLFLKIQYSLAIPSVEPQNMGIPYLAGVLSLVIDTGMIFPANTPLIFGLMRGRFSWAAIGIVLAFGNAGIDLLFGSKDTVIYQIIICAILFYATYRGPHLQMPKARRLVKSLAVPTGVLGLAVLIAYPLMNSYRFARISGLSFTSAVTSAVTGANYDDANPILSVYNRITGIEVMTALMNTRNYLASDSILQNLLSTELVANIAYQVIGVEQSQTRFSVTQMGYFYVVGGYPTLIIGCLLIGVFFCLAQEIALRFPVQNVMIVAFIPVLWILAAKLLLGGGNLTLALKELLIVMLVFLGWGWLACRPKRASQSRARSRPMPKLQA